MRLSTTPREESLMTEPTYKELKAQIVPMQRAGRIAT